MWVRFSIIDTGTMIETWQETTGYAPNSVKICSHGYDMIRYARLIFCLSV